MHPSPSITCLYGAAGGQMGHFTAAQARGCGFSTNLISYHTGTGKFIRVHRGVYRLRDYPSWPREEVMAAWLAVGKERAVVSHESALDLLELSDVIPDHIHLTVPRTIRNLPTLPGVKIHTSTTPPRGEDLRNVDGMLVTSPVRTILDAAEWGTMGNQIELAIWQAMSEGRASPRRLKEQAEVRSTRVQQLVDQSIAVAARNTSRRLRSGPHWKPVYFNSLASERYRLRGCGNLWCSSDCRQGSCSHHPERGW